MSILNKKYDGLKPQLSYLADEVILSQAWKKSQSYIRSHNWYADTLELDCSAANMENLIGIWKQELNSLEYFPNEMRLVPAPKSDEWTFSCLENGEWVWGPQQKEKSTGNNASVVTDKELRPLAHLTIRDQTVASSIMLCLADAIESEQGSTDPEHKHEVWSYGNRLFCDWEGKSAKFRWGNSSVYSKYFQDYQRFLERPIKKAQIEWPSLVSSESLYEVHLDIAAFYDSIDRERLIKVLKSISKNHYCSEINEDNDFWTIVNNTIFGWKWSRDDNILACCLKNSILPEKIGVPQGLVASGFFANAYLIELDNMVSKFIGQPYETITLIDYCRYVDDIRLLVKISGNDKDDIIQWLEKNIYPCVSLINGIVLNKEKFKIEKVFASKSETSSRMKVIQQAMSGPQDKNAIDDMLGSLDGLFSMAELFRGDKRSAYNNCDILLSHIDNPQMDVREDTLLRFAANRIALALDKKRLLVGDETNEENGLHELDRFCESMARRFIAVWSQNPSLVSVLKKGFSLYPHQKILKPVIDVLFKKIVNGNIKITTSVNEIRVAIYCISEIFKFAALELSPKKLQPWPFHSDVEGFLKLLLKYARSLISREIPWYLRQQIVLFLAVSGERLCSDRINIKDGEEDKYQLLQCILCGNHPFETDKILEDKMATFIIAHQISHDRDKIVGNLGIWLDKLKKNKHQPAVETILESISLNDPLMFRSLLEYGQQVASDWYQGASIICRRYGFDHQALSGKMEEFNGRDIPLAAVIKRPDNPFAHENGLLELANEALSLLEKKANFEKGTNSKGNSLSPQFLKITCSDWTKLQSADSDLRDKLITLTWVAGNRRDKRYKSPGWLADNEDSNSLYQLGCFLRACAIGDMDFTATKLLSSAGPWYTYFGINSSWYKRRIGMAHQPETLIGEAAPMSSWISELLYRLLQWPGLTLYSSKLTFPADLTLKVIRRIIIERLEILENIYGKSSKLPLVIKKVRHSFKKKNHLCVVMVQSLLPQISDFTREGPSFDGSYFRKKHREHVASLAKIICDKLRAEKKAKGENVAKPFADLILFPELSIHPTDIDILKQLADKTGAMIFTGLTYQKKDELLINTALWLIPFVNGHGRQWIVRYQGKKHLTKEEISAGINSWRPYQLVIELEDSLGIGKQGFRLSGAICYDATDIGLATDLRKIINTFIVLAFNRDTETFDTMVDALHYHMFQPVILVNSGEFGGSAAKAPYKEKFHKRIAHVHGSNQISISMFELNMHDFGNESEFAKSGKELKTKPAGLDTTI